MSGRRYPAARTEGTPDDCRSPVTRALIAYWLERRPVGGGLVRWRDIELMDLYEIAHRLVVKDVLDGGDDFRNRYWGSDLTTHLGFEATGARVSGYEPESMRDAVLARYRRIVRTAVPEMVRGHVLEMPDKDHLTFELVHLPLAGDGVGVGHILSAYHFGFAVAGDEAMAS